jgi:class 3 adenylate cyclase
VRSAGREAEGVQVEQQRPFAGCAGLFRPGVIRLGACAPGDWGIYTWIAIVVNVHKPAPDKTRPGGEAQGVEVMWTVAMSAFAAFCRRDRVCATSHGLFATALGTEIVEVAAVRFGRRAIHVIIRLMPPLDAKQRAKLSDSAFAYIDSRGRRRLPINDAAHVRNALARFNQVVFEDEAARDKARTRLLRAAAKHGVVPIGFVSAQLQPQRKLPQGRVTFLLTDVEGSTELLHRLDDRYASLIAAVRRAMRGVVRKTGGREVDARADDLFAVFEQAPAALEAALAIQRAMQAGPWLEGIDVQVRIGIHSGRPRLTETGYVGMSVHTAARICYAAHGGQIVLSSAVRSAVLESLAEGISLRNLGSWRFQGLREPEELYQVDAADLPADFPPLRAGELVAKPKR